MDKIAVSTRLATVQSDSETSLWFYRARYYNPSLQRFISEDPIGFAGGDANLYGYAAQSPSNFVDPTGLKIVATGDIASVYLALDYLSDDPFMGMVIQDLIDSPTAYHIDTNSDQRDGYNGLHTVNWDPHAGLTCSGKHGQQGAQQSPALALGHELVHMSHGFPLAFIDSFQGTGNDYDNLEEKITIQGIETHAAMTLGEGIRQDHRGLPVRVRTPLTKPDCGKCARTEQNGYPWGGPI